MKDDNTGKKVSMQGEEEISDRLLDELSSCVAPIVRESLSEVRAQAQEGSADCELAREEEASRGRNLSSQQAKLLSELRVGVGVEVGTLEISAEELIDLYSGQSFEFEFDPDAPVKLRVGEELVAEAKFVLDGDKLALEVSSVFCDGDSKKSQPKD